jgi:nuclear GTP-binding protein
MPKIRKRTSKRVNLRTKYSVLHKVSEHHKKLRRQAKRMVGAGLKTNKPGKKESAIPNSFPDKENLVNAIEAQHLAA